MRAGWCARRPQFSLQGLWCGAKHPSKRTLLHSSASFLARSSSPNSTARSAARPRSACLGRRTRCRCVQQQLCKACQRHGCQQLCRCASGVDAHCCHACWWAQQHARPSVGRCSPRRGLPPHFLAPQEGGGRKGLPKSFLNRFTRVHVELLQRTDLLFIAGGRVGSGWTCVLKWVGGVDGSLHAPVGVCCSPATEESV